jgi:hypothetical protein
VSKFFNPVTWVYRHIPRNQVQLERDIKKVLTIAFWVALLAPVVLVPLVYLVLAFLR